MKNAKQELQIAERKAAEGFDFVVTTEGFGGNIIYVKGRAEAHTLRRKHPNAAIWDMDVWLNNLRKSIFESWEEFNEVAGEDTTEELGDVQTFGWYGFSVFFPPLYVEEDDATVAAAIIHEDNYGFRDADPYKTEEEAQKVWANIQDDYSVFLEEDDEEEEF